jgi:hypothetical protein
MITLTEVKEILLTNKGIAYPYPRKGQISINGGRGKPATKEAIQFAREFYKTKQ